MEKKELLNKIQSKFILNNIFDYIKDTNFKLKLFIHSKSIQNKLDLKIINYKELYLNKIGFDLDKYLYTQSCSKNILNINYKNFLLKINFNKDEFENVLYEILKRKETGDINEPNRKKNNNKLIVDIYSPLLEIISKLKIFEKYTIYISQNTLDVNLVENYTKLFNKLNKSNIKYTSIYYSFKDIKKINYLKEINLDFNNIKRIILDIKANDYIINEEYKYYFLTFFRFDALQNNLSYLKIKPNNFKSFNIDFFENVNFKELKELDLSNNKISDIKVLEKVKLEKLEKLNLDWNKISNINILKNVDFKN